MIAPHWVQRNPVPSDGLYRADAGGPTFGPPSYAARTARLVPPGLFQILRN